MFVWGIWWEEGVRNLVGEGVRVSWVLYMGFIALG